MECSSGLKNSKVSSWVTKSNTILHRWNIHKPIDKSKLPIKLYSKDWRKGLTIEKGHRLMSSGAFYGHTEQLRSQQLARPLLSSLMRLMLWSQLKLKNLVGGSLFGLQAPRPVENRLIFQAKPGRWCIFRRKALKQRIAKRYNSTVIPYKFEEGDLVLWCANIEPPTLGQGKLTTNWEGPYWIIQVLGKRAYKLSTLAGSKVPRLWNASNLRKFYA